MQHLAFKGSSFERQLLVGYLKKAAEGPWVSYVSTKFGKIWSMYP